MNPTQLVTLAQVVAGLNGTPALPAFAPSPPSTSHIVMMASPSPSPTEVVAQVETATDVEDEKDDASLKKEMEDTMEENICDDQARIKMAENTIAREKKIEKETGVKDLKALHDAGATMVMLKERDQKALKIYKDTLGKEFNSKCEGN